MTQLLADLKALRVLLTPSEAWTKGCFAKDYRGESVNSLSNDAQCWCLRGGASKIADDRQVRAYDMASALEAALDSSSSLANWNDAPERTHAEVLALIDGAIAREEGGN